MAYPRDDLVDLHVAKTPFEAEVIAGVLRDAGIPVYVAGEELNDEWALSQRLMNLQGVVVTVPRDRVEEARQVLDEAREAGRMMDVDQDDGGEGPTEPPA